ncbi:MAG: class I SAM-dependent methyltransferase [Janthinobacterium lividum]
MNREKGANMSTVENAIYTDQQLVDLYDLVNSGEEDYAFYERKIGRECRRVLDLGCGTGTFALRLVAAGHKVVAVDPAPMMIDYARGRWRADTVQWIAGDASSVPNSPLFDVVAMTGHAFQCLLTDDEVAATLQRSCELLVSGGRFMFETRNPAVLPWTTWTPTDSARSIHSEKHGPVDFFQECTSVAEQIVEFETHYTFRQGNTRQSSKSRLRFMPREALAEAVSKAGFRDVQWFGDWEGGPFEEESSAEIIAVCKA